MLDKSPEVSMVTRNTHPIAMEPIDVNEGQPNERLVHPIKPSK